MDINIQPILETEKVILYPLQQDDFEELFASASDPKIWEQHPNQNRWQKDAFQNFFQGAIESKGAFKVVNKSTNAIIGSTRFYDYDPKENQILIGYTFYNTESWGTGINSSVKILMLEYIFQYVAKVIFHVGSLNIRSQTAMERLGIIKTGAEEVAYFGEPSKLNFVYTITKNQWLSLQNN